MVLLSFQNPPEALVNHVNFWVPSQTYSAESPGFRFKNLQICIFNKLTNWFICSLKFENLDQEEWENISVRDPKETDGTLSLGQLREGFLGEGLIVRGLIIVQRGTAEANARTVTTPKPKGRMQNLEARESRGRAFLSRSSDLCLRNMARECLGGSVG